MPTQQTRARGAYSLAARFGNLSPVKRATGLTMAELEVLAAVAACEQAEHGYPTRIAIQQVTGGGRSNLPSELVARGLLRQVERTKEHLAVYAVTDAGRAVLG